MFFKKRRAIIKLKTYGQNSFDAIDAELFVEKKLQKTLHEAKELDSLLQDFCESTKLTGSSQKLKENIVADALTFFAEQKKEAKIPLNETLVETKAAERPLKKINYNGFALSFASIGLALLLSVAMLYERAKVSADSGVVFYQEALQEDISFMMGMEGDFFVSLGM